MANEPKVLNRYKMTSEETGIYIGRGSLWGNQFVIGQDGNRMEVCDKFQDYIDNLPTSFVAEAKKQLKGHNLICFCKPHRCHGDSWLKLVNELD